VAQAVGPLELVQAVAQAVGPLELVQAVAQAVGPLEPVWAVDHRQQEPDQGLPQD
jgi:hypothetical protein